jgi:hypothetical protein
MLMLLLFVSVALAQGGRPDVPDAPQPQPSVAAQTEPAPVAGTGSSSDDKLISQAGKYPPVPGRRMGSHRGRAYPAFPPPPALSPVGALIGFGVGAAAGASNSGESTVGTHVALGLIGGGLGALIGGAIGAVVNPFARARRVRRPSGPDDDEEAGLRSGEGKTHSRQSIVSKPASPSPTTAVQSTGASSSEILAAP